MENQITTIDQYIEDAPVWVDDVAYLLSWGVNYDYRQSPMTMFLDMVGINEEKVYDYEHGLGYLELDLLGKALSQYSERPCDIIDWIHRAIAIEIGDNE